MNDKLKVEKISLDKTEQAKNLLMSKKLWIIIGAIIVLLGVIRFTVLKSDKMIDNKTTISTTEATVVTEVKTIVPSPKIIFPKEAK